jgi:uncharacterized protein YbbC (DUF1343 family)
MKAKILVSFGLFLSTVVISCGAEPQKLNFNTESQPQKGLTLHTGAENTEAYLPLLKGKKVGLVVNQTSMVGEKHLLDTLISLGVQVKSVFAPEHGFRGTADAGEHVKNGIDPSTGTPLVSLYGSNKKPTVAQVKDLDILIFDIQDVGARFYTYISTLHYVMEAAAENGKKVIVLDRPNPNGHYVDGPVLETANQSFVGMHPIPVVHGMTIGEYAQMINGEKWLSGGLTCDLQVITMSNYDHNMVYAPPVKPSPNLPNLRSIYLYPALCFFEGTPFSVGRGTSSPFQLWGHPNCSITTATFTPQSLPGAKTPPLLGKTCYGVSYADQSTESFRNFGFNLQPIIQAYKNYKGTEPFFNNFFIKLAGTALLQQQISQGMSEEAIRKTWEPKLSQFKSIRKKYLLYTDFE